MKNRPLLSVIIPIYNAKSYIEKCLLSVLDQGFDINQLEVICVDDGSNDGSEELLDEFAILHPEVRVFHKDNGGVSSARNYGMGKMTGYYFEFVDIDDELVPNSIKEIVERMHEEKCAVAPFAYTREMYSECSELVYSISTMVLTGAIWRYIFSAESFGQVRFDECLHYAEDTFFAQTVALHNPICLHTEKKCYIYRDNPNSVMKKRNFLRVAESMLRLAENHKRYLQERSFPDEQRRIERWSARATAAYIYYSLRGNNNEEPFSMLQQRGLWPYKKEWQLLKIRFKNYGGIRQTVSNYCLFFVGLRPMWRIFQKTGLLKRFK